MTNTADNPKPIRHGDVITADWLNATRAPDRVTGGDGIEVARAGNSLVVAPRSPAVRAPERATVFATIATEVSAGKYTWTRTRGEGPASGTAYGTEGISAGTEVVLHKTGGVWVVAPTSSAFTGAAFWEDDDGGSLPTSEAAAFICTNNYYAFGMTVPTAGKIQVDTAGWYRLDFAVKVLFSAGASLEFYWKRTGTGFTDVVRNFQTKNFDGSSRTLSLSGGGDEYLYEGDVLDTRIWSSAGASLIGYGLTWSLKLNKAA